MSRRAATPAGQSPAESPIDVTRVRMSASSNGDRRTGGIARIRRMPDSARRTTSDPPGGVEPRGGVELVDRRHPPGQGGRGVPPLPHRRLLRGRLRQVVRDHQGGAGNGANPRSVVQAVNLAQSDRYAFFVFTAVEASTAASTSARACSGTCGPADPPLLADSVSRAAVSSASRTSRSLGNTGGTCGAADDGADALASSVDDGVRDSALDRVGHRAPPAEPLVPAVQHGAPTAGRNGCGVSERSWPGSPDLGRVTYIGCAATADNGTLCEPKDCE